MSSGLALEMQRAHGDGWKRYPAYKDSGVEWLGAVPEGWDVKRLKRMFRVINGSTPKSGISEYWDGDISWVTPDDLGRLKSEAINETARKITDLGYQSCGTTLAPAGSLVLSTRAPIGHLAIAEIDLCANQGCRSLIFKYGDNKRYFYYQLLAARPELESWGQGSTFRELGKGKLEAIELFSPPLPEQHAIAAFLDRETGRIDALLAKKERQIGLLQEKRAALISHAVTRGLDPDAPMKDSGVAWIGAVPEGWGVKRLKYLASESLKYGANESAELDDPDLPRYIRITDIAEDGSLRVDTFKSLPEDVARLYLLKSGDILFARSGATVGKSFMYHESWGRACYAGYLIRLRVNYR
jgi:type I restriction enzyme S subunit